MCVFFFQAEDGIRDAQESRGLGDVYKRQNGVFGQPVSFWIPVPEGADPDALEIYYFSETEELSLIHI